MPPKKKSKSQVSDEKIERLLSKLDRVAVKNLRWHHGLAFQTDFNDTMLVLNPFVPGSKKTDEQKRKSELKDEQEDGEKPLHSWTGRNQTLFFSRKLKDGKLVVFAQEHLETRLRMTVGLVSVRDDSIFRVKAEEKARKKLKQSLDERQWHSYVLNDAFFETSYRSNTMYLIRRSRPTLAFRFSAKEDTDQEVNVQFLAALCLHPFGYYDNSWAGVMTPSDEVRTHVLKIRSDERKFWAQAEQHSKHDPVSGI